MNLTENEKRMVYQVESTCQAAILNEIAMNKRYAPNPEIRQTAESLLSKLRLLSDKECMALVNDVQKNYRLPGKARTIGEMLAEARQKSGAEKLAGHDIMALERFDPDTRHMIVFDVLSHESPMGYKGERMRLFLTEQGYQKARENQDRGFKGERNDTYRNLIILSKEVSELVGATNPVKIGKLLKDLQLTEEMKDKINKLRKHRELEEIQFEDYIGTKK